ncbi:hypothetical protein ACJIZ3_001686 [Penstemon smallii]|uniref:Uncharacterized protein n=1 Tax=Penstemon smallii TaxID=265156 RepID=A0ABD3U6T2_9LAMI
MHSGFEIPYHQQEDNMMAVGDNSSGPPVLLSAAMNQTHILEQIHTTTSTQQLFFDQQQFLPPNHHHHHYYPPVNFKLGLNSSTSSTSNKLGESGINEPGPGPGPGQGAFLHGSEQYDVPEEPILPHCSWQNQQDSSIKQPFWEPLPAQVSNENSEEIVNTLENKDQSLRNSCFNRTKSRILFGELEAIYKRFGTIETTNQTAGTNDILPEASIGEASASLKKRKGKTQKSDCDDEVMINSTARFFERLVKQVMEHQDSLHRKFAQVVERLDLERREREEAWRNQELAYFEQEAADRVREKALATTREATIVEYLEKITGEKINLPPFDPSA